VLRPGKVRFYEEQQLALLFSSYRRIRILTQDATDPLLIACTPSGVRVRTIEELIHEFDRGRRLP